MGKRTKGIKNRVAKTRQRKNARKAARKSRRARQEQPPRKVFQGVSTRTLNTAEIHGAFVSPAIFEQGMGPIVIARKMPGGRIAFGMFLIDAFCLGVKNSCFDICPKKAFQGFVDEIAGPLGLPRDDPARARKLIEDAIGFAGNLGFKPHRDFRDAEVILGDIEANECSETFQFGKDGKPLYIGGPHDSPAKIRRILATLEETCGPDGYHYLFGTDDLEDLDDFWGDAELEEDEDGSEDEDWSGVFSAQIEAADADWESLFAAAQQIRDIEPWRFMAEDDLFGVQFPGRDEIGYVSVMGLLGEHLAISVYLGTDAIKTFFKLHDLGPEGVPADRILEMRQLMVSFEDRGNLKDFDRELIREFGPKFRGLHGCPLFRSYRPGFLPWLLDSDEVELLTVALEQTADVVERIEDDPDHIPWEAEPGGRCLVRTPIQRWGGWAWRDVIGKFPLPDFSAATEVVDPAHIRQFSRLKGAPAEVEMDLFIFPGAVGQPGERPLLPLVLLVVERGTGTVLGVELPQARDGLEEMWKELPEFAHSIFKKANVRPVVIGIAHPRLQDRMAPIAAAAGFTIERCEALPFLDPARESLLEQMMG